MNTIFVQMAAYRDPQLVPTLLDMLTHAEHPENLHVGICWQHGEEDPIDIFLDAGFVLESGSEFSKDLPLLHLSKDGAKFTVIDLHFHKTQGACWARHQIQQLYSGEKYTMQLDSHHRFVEGWDKVCIDMLEGLREDGYEKPLLTAYIPSFDPENDPAARVMDPWKMDFDRFIPEGAVFFMPSTIDNWRELDKPTRARFFSAHFAFADGTFAVEVQHDPEYFFHGEEISIAVRAYTHGYDLFHPHRLIAWHEYTRKGRIKVWDDHTTNQRNKGRVELDWVQRNDLCHKRNRILFGMDGEDPKQIDFGKYGFGDKRTVLQYEEYAGISFKYRGVQQKTIDRLDPPGDFKYETEEQWKATFIGSHDIRVLVHRAELGEEPYDYDFWYVGSADDNGTEIFRKDAQEDEIKNYVQNEWIDFRLIWRGDKPATKYIVWPHSRSRGWGNRIEKDVQP
ncbi:glycosyl transferase [Xanthomonas phage Xoo-sp13]|nr:glycosyl transferase [Xanthomonas phage Xoo-sp13]